MASNTENLNLLMKNPSTDGADTFNVQTMLNENWQKIDANAGSVTQTLANILKPTTPPIIGLPPSTTPDGMFQALGNTGELHVWRKTVTTTSEKPAGYTLGDAESGTAISVPNVGSQNYVTLQYGPSITVNDGGGVSLTSVTGSIQFQRDSDVSAIYDIRNNFVRATPNGSSNSAFDGVIFVPNDCSFKNTAGIVTFGKFYRVNAYPLTPAGTTTTYPVSTNPNAYQEGNDAKPAGYTLGDVVTGSFKMGESNVSYPYLYNVSSALAVSEDGTISIDSATSNSVRIGFGYSLTVNTLQTAIAGKFIKYVEQSGVSSATSAPDTVYPFNTRGVIVFIPSDAKVTQSDAQYIVSKYQPVTGYPAIPAGTTIEYLGKLGDKARVQVVSYVGTGTYGSSNPNSLTFDFVPKVIMVRDNETGNCFLEAIYGMKFAVVKYSSGDSVSMIWNEKTVSWYSAGDPYYQMNSSGTKYYAVAIG